MKLILDHTPLEISPHGSGSSVRIGDETFIIDLLSAADGKLEMLLNGTRVTAYVSSDGPRRWVTINGRTFLLTKTSGARAGRGRQQEDELVAPMPGQVRAINVHAGDAVTRGQTLVVVEAMKMEIRVTAPANGIVSKVFVKEGETVERGQILIDMEES
jgi:biotin carboxyl carrier protein